MVHNWPHYHWVQGALLPERKPAGGLKLTTQHHVMPRLRIYGAVPTSPLHAFLAYAFTLSLFIYLLFIYIFIFCVFFRDFIYLFNPSWTLSLFLSVLRSFSIFNSFCFISCGFRPFNQLIHNQLHTNFQTKSFFRIQSLQELTTVAEVLGVFGAVTVGVGTHSPC